MDIDMIVNNTPSDLSEIPTEVLEALQARIEAELMDRHLSTPEGKEWMEQHAPGGFAHNRRD